MTFLTWVQTNMDGFTIHSLLISLDPVNNRPGLNKKSSRIAHMNY